ncbi:LysR family transcriptional regulator [Roseovarius arcticus]|uniref:LysR family transcriptional regulator n=1 Tax=Roseovarius arcticus TaxID=2547404 RepID=UPI001110E855|nr:LysR family transcriptional regulator [Roseovarius arcticus]
MTLPYAQRFAWNLDWNLLRTFMVLVDEGGITPAATFLGLKQPTISSALKRLEAQVGQRLINRSSTHFSVTPLGDVLYREACTIFGTVMQLPTLLDAAEDKVTGHVAIALASHVASRHLDAVLERFNAAHPDVTYSLSIAESEEVIGRVAHNRVSFGVCLVTHPAAALDYRVLYREYFGHYCGPGHHLFGKAGLKLRDLRGEQAVSFQTDSATGPLFELARLRQKAEMRPDLKGISSSLSEVRRLIMTNVGIGALPVHVAASDVAAGRLWQLPPKTDLPAIDIHMVSNPARTLNRAEAALTDMLITEIAEVPLSQRSYS